MLDADAYPRGPNGLAALCKDQIAELEAQRKKLPRAEREAINRRLHTCRMLLKWCQTRAGYVA
jgi:hypothetical protein